MRWGEQRQTQDVDLSLLTSFGREEPFATALLARFEGRVPDALDFALRNRVLLIRASSGASLDISLAGLPFEERVIERASLFEFAPGYRFKTCSAEDLIVMKAFAARPRDWLDIDTIKTRQPNRINWKQVLRELQPLAEVKEAPEIVSRVRRLAET